MSQSSPAKNIVLVHGAFADGSSWSKVIPLLQAKGLHVTSVAIPLTSYADDVAATKRAIATQDGPVILVGHSYGGVVITEAGSDPKVVGLVYVAAFARTPTNPSRISALLRSCAKAVSMPSGDSDKNPSGCGTILLPGFPGAPHDEPMCLDPVFLKFFQDAVARRPLRVDRVGISYMYAGGWVPNSPHAAAAPTDYHVGPHIMIVVPNGAGQADYTTDARAGGAYINRVPGTGMPYLVIPIHEWPRE